MHISPLYLAITLISAAPVLADTVSLPRVSVTATGVEQADSETPLSTTTLDEQKLFSKGSLNVGDALRGEAGISVGNDSAQGQNPYLRGLGRERIVLLVDGIRLNSAQPAGSVSSSMTLALAEQLEVVRGSASSLYGTGALGGVINVRLPQARFDDTSFTARASLNSVDKRRQLAAVVNTGNHNHALTLGAAVANVDDYQAPAGKVEQTGYDSQSLIGQYRFRLDDTELRLSYQQQQDDDLWYPGSRRPHPTNPATRSIIIHSPEQIRSLLEAGINQTLGAGKLDLRIYRQDVERTINAEANWLQRDIITNKVTFETEGADLRYDHSLNDQHQFSTGLNYWEMNANPDRWMAGPPSFDTFVANNPFQDGRITALGAFVQDSLTLGQMQILTALRHDKADADAASMGNGSRTSGLDHSDSATSGSLALMYRINDLLRPYVRLSRAFRAPDMRERYESGERGDGYFYLGSPDIKAETAQQIELGLKGSKPTLEYQIALHQQDIDDYISGKILRNGATDPAITGCSSAYCKQTVNLGSATIKGLDASADWQWTEGQWLSAALSVIRGRNNDLDEDLFQMPADELNLGWRMALTSRLQLAADWRYVAKQDRVATQFSRGSENPSDSFSTLDLSLAWQVNSRHDLQLALTNLGDEEYHEHLTEGQAGTEIKAPGRGLQLHWQGHF